MADRAGGRHVVRWTDRQRRHPVDAGVLATSNRGGPDGANHQPATDRRAPQPSRRLARSEGRRDRPRPDDRPRRIPGRGEDHPAEPHPLRRPRRALRGARQRFRRAGRRRQPRRGARRGHPHLRQRLRLLLHGRRSGGRDRSPAGREPAPGPDPRRGQRRRRSGLDRGRRHPPSRTLPRSGGGHRGPERLRAALAALAPRVLRAKGFVVPADGTGDDRLLVQACGRTVELEAGVPASAPPSHGAAPPPSALVFVGLDDLPDEDELAGAVWRASIRAESRPMSCRG